MSVVKRTNGLNLSILKKINSKELSDENMYYLNSMPFEIANSCLHKLESTTTTIRSVPSFLHAIIMRSVKENGLKIPPFEPNKNSEKKEIKEKPIQPTILKENEDKKRKRSETEIEEDITESLSFDDFPEITPHQEIPLPQKRLSDLSFNLFGGSDLSPNLIEETQMKEDEDDDLIVQIDDSVVKELKTFPPINEQIPKEYKERIEILREKIAKQKQNFMNILKKI